MFWSRTSVLILFIFSAQALLAHEQPQPGADAPRSDQGNTHSNAPREHPGRKLLRSGKGNLNSGSAATGGPFDASNIEFLSQLTLTDMGAGGGEKGNDIWGWTDSDTGNEYALVGRSDGTAFVDVTDPYNPVYLGFLATHTGSTAWRDVKVYDDHAYIVSDNNGSHGMQIFDLTGLRSVASPPAIFTETAHYSGFRNGHNIVINEASGYAYAVGTNTQNGGLHFIDISDPTSPVAAGGFSADDYTHDAQVVIYDGPDASYTGREIAFNSNEDTLTIVDVTDKTSPAMLSRTGYSLVSYAHQGWLTEDHRYFISNDELDEKNRPLVRFTRTHLWDVADLDAPVYMGFYEATVKSIDHNLYVHNGLAYAANYTTGLRVLDLSDIAKGNLAEIAHIDTHPVKNSLTAFDGAWSVYPFFNSGTLIIGDRDEGLISARLIHAELSVTAVDTPDPVALDAVLTYTLNVTNKEPDAAANTTLTDTLPVGVSYLQAIPSQGGCSESAGVVTCALGVLANGASAAVSLTVTASTLGSMNNTVAVSADELDLDDSDNTVNLDTTVQADQDGDGLSDAFEVSIGTNPALADSDGDNVSDYDEVAFDGDETTYTPGVDLDPLSPDTDGDLVQDDTDPLPLVYHHQDGDLAPLGSPNDTVDAADYLIALRIVLGDLLPAELEYSHGDVYPKGAPDGVINMSDVILILQYAQGTLVP
jgi:choice-of-anchor B domain-containing protein